MPYSTGSGVKSVVVCFVPSISFQLGFQITSHWGLSYFTLSKTAPMSVKKVEVGFYVTFLVLQDLRTTPTGGGQISSLVNKTIEDWMATKPTWKTQFQLKSFPVFHRRAWIEFFFKYNTGIPSSAAIERVFSVRSDVMKPKRATLSSENFERMVFI